MFSPQKCPVTFIFSNRYFVQKKCIIFAVPYFSPKASARCPPLLELLQNLVILTALNFLYFITNAVSLVCLVLWTLSFLRKKPVPCYFSSSAPCHSKHTIGTSEILVDTDQYGRQQISLVLAQGMLCRITVRQRTKLRSKKGV